MNYQNPVLECGKKLSDTGSLYIAPRRSRLLEFFVESLRKKNYCISAEVILTVGN